MRFCHNLGKTTTKLKTKTLHGCDTCEVSSMLSDNQAPECCRTISAFLRAAFNLQGSVTFLLHLKKELKADQTIGLSMNVL